MIYQLIISLIVLAVIYVICCFYHYAGYKRGYKEGLVAGAEFTSQIITANIKAGTVTLDGKPVRIVEDKPGSVSNDPLLSPLIEPILPKADVIFGIDGNRHTCRRPDFINLQESLCGYGDTHAEAFADLLAKEKGTK